MEILLPWIEIAATAVEILAIVIIVGTVLAGTAFFVGHGISQVSYARYKHMVGKGLLLGLEILVAADVIRTVALEPTMSNILGLGLLMVIRTFLSWSLMVEIDNRWPWQSGRATRGASPER